MEEIADGDHPVALPEICTISETAMQALNDQIQASVCEQVNVSVKAMAQSVADIISASLNERMSSIENENRRLTEQVQMLSIKVTELETHKQTSELKMDDLEQYSRRSCLRIAGVLETKGESTDELVLDIARECNVEMCIADIDRSHRVRNRKKPSDNYGTSRPCDIIVKFVSYRTRAEFMNNRFRLKNNSSYKSTYINKDLTRQRVELLRYARQYVKDRKIQSAWSFDGRIYIKCLDESRHQVSSQDDLDTLISPPDELSKSK